MNDRMVCGSPEQRAVGARIVAAGLGAERIEPEPVAAVGADFQFQIFHRIDHPLVFVIFLQQRIGLDHAFDQLGGAAEFPGLRIDGIGMPLSRITWNMVRRLNMSLIIDLGAELAVQLRAHLRARHRPRTFGLAIG